MELASNDTSLSGLPKKKNSKVYIFILVVVFILIVISAVFYKQGIWPKKEIVNLPPAPQYTKTDLPADKLPEIFPEGLIQEKNPMILENFSASFDNGKQTQYTLKYITKKSIGENLEAYNKYFKKNKWFILNQDQKDNFAVIRAGKKSDLIYDSIIVTHTINQTNGIQIIDLNLTHFLLEKSASSTN